MKMKNGIIVTCSPLNEERQTKCQPLTGGLGQRRQEPRFFSETYRRIKELEAVTVCKNVIRKIKERYDR